MKKEKRFLDELESKLEFINKRDKNAIVLKYKKIIDERKENKERIVDILKSIGNVDEVAQKEIEEYKESRAAEYKINKFLSKFKKDKETNSKTSNKKKNDTKKDKKAKEENKDIKKEKELKLAEKLKAKETKEDVEEEKEEKKGFFARFKKDKTEEVEEKAKETKEEVEEEKEEKKSFFAKFKKDKTEEVEETKEDVEEKAEETKEDVEEVKEEKKSFFAKFKKDKTEEVEETKEEVEEEKEEKKSFFDRFKKEKTLKEKIEDKIEEEIEEGKNELAEVAEIVAEKRIFETKEERTRRIILKTITVIFTIILLFILLWASVVFIASIFAYLDGVKLYGITIALGGFTMLLLFLILLINRSVFGRKISRKWPFIFIILNVLIMGAGIAIFVRQVYKIKVTSDVTEKYSMTKKTESYNLPSDPDKKIYVTFNSNYKTDYIIEYDDTISEKVNVEVKYFECYYDYFVKKESNNIYISLGLDNRDRLSVYIDDLKEGKIYDNDEFERYTVKIIMNENDRERVIIK